MEAMGFFSYELNLWLQKLSNFSRSTGQIPTLLVVFERCRKIHGPNSHHSIGTSFSSAQQVGQAALIPLLS